jgi:hypothetical protein
MTQGVGAGARAARDGAARAEPASGTDGRRRWAARGARGGADLAAVGAARDDLRGDREAQGPSRGCWRARLCGWWDRMRGAKSVTCSIHTRCSSGFRRGPSRPGFEAHGPFASEFATEHTAGEGECLKKPRFHSAAEPKTARRMKPVIGPAIAACRGWTLQDAPEPASQPGYDSAAAAVACQWRPGGERAALSSKLPNPT